MKKTFLFGTVLMAIILGLSFVSPIANASAAVCNAESYSEVTEVQAIKNRESTIADLIIQKAHYLQTTGQTPAELQDELDALGVSEMTTKEVVELSLSDNSIAPMSVGEGWFSDHSEITEVDDIIFETFSEEARMNGKLYTYKLVFAMPNSNNSRLHQNHAVDSLFFSNRLVSGTKTFISTLIKDLASSVVNDSLFEIAVSLNDAFGAAWEEITPTDHEYDVEFEYNISLSEICCFSYIFLDGDDWTSASGYKLIQKSNLISATLQSNYLTADYSPETGSGDYPGKTKILTYTKDIEYRSEFFADGYDSAKYYIERNQKYIPDTRLESFDFYGFENSKICTVDLLTPYNPAVLGYRN